MFKSFPRWRLKYVHILVEGNWIFYHSENNKEHLAGLCCAIEKDYIKIYQNLVYDIFPKEKVTQIRIGV